MIRWLVIAWAAILAARTQTAGATRGFAHEGVLGWFETGFSDLLARIIIWSFDICFCLRGALYAPRAILTWWATLSRGSFCAGRALFALRTIFSRGVFAARGQIFTLGTIFTLRAVLTRGTFLSRLAVIALLIVTREIVFSVEFVRILSFVTTFGTAIALIILTDALIGDNPEIMIGELQVIFGLNAITVKVRIMRQLAILFEHLRRIATRTAVNPVKLLAIAAAALTIVVCPSAPAVIVATIVVIQG